MTRYKPALVLHLRMHPADVGRMTLADLHLCVDLVEQLAGRKG